MESQQKRQRTTRLSGRNLKRKLSRETDAASIVMQITEVEDEEADLVVSIRQHVEVLNSSFSDREAVKGAAAAISSLAKIDENVEMMVENGVIPALVRYLESPWSSAISANVPKSCDHKLEKDCALSLGLIAAIQPGYQQLIVDAGAIVPTVKLLKRRGICLGCMEANAVIRRAADIITNIAHDNPRIKINIRVEGGIPPLVELLNFPDIKVQRAAAGALRTVSFRNDENKNQIVELNALPTLVLMLQSEDPSMHGEAIGAIGNLVHSSPDIKKEVIRAGALQPVIGLLSSTCLETQREAALLIGQFASPDSDCKSSDEQVMEMSAFALGRLAQDTHNQAGIGQRGGIISLLNLLDVHTGSVQHNAAFALYGLADNEENLADFIKAGGIQRLQDDNFTVQVLNQLLYLMRSTEKTIQRRIALAFAHLCDPKDGKLIFVDNNGIEFLLELLYLPSMKQQKYSSRALFELARKASSFAPEDSAPSSPTQRERNAQNVEIPNISWEVFELMMRFLMVKAYRQEHVYKHPWERVSAASWRKFADPENKRILSHILEVDTLNRKLDTETGKLHTTRALTIHAPGPWFLHRIVGQDICHCVESTVVDGKSRSMQLTTKNISLQKFIEVEERIRYDPHPENPSAWTVCSQETSIRIKPLSALASMAEKVEQKCAEKFMQNSVKGREVMERICRYMEAESAPTAKSKTKRRPAANRESRTRREQCRRRHIKLGKRYGMVWELHRLHLSRLDVCSSICSVSYFNEIKTIAGFLLQQSSENRALI
ncbi:hypothetical protein Bca4012_012211 [Brassica carinata]